MLFTVSNSIIFLSSGYFCYSGSNSSTPNLDSDGDECPTGQYCPSGSVQPTACPPGTYNPTTRRESVDQCTNCTAGYYCSEYNMTAAGPQCDTGRGNSFYARKKIRTRHFSTSEMPTLLRNSYYFVISTQYINKQFPCHFKIYVLAFLFHF